MVDKSYCNNTHKKLLALVSQYLQARSRRLLQNGQVSTYLPTWVPLTPNYLLGYIGRLRQVYLRRECRCYLLVLFRLVGFFDLIPFHWFRVGRYSSWYLGRQVHTFFGQQHFSEVNGLEEKVIKFLKLLKHTWNEVMM